MKCTCPYIPCALRGNCAACVEKSVAGGTLTNCMERIAMGLGAKLDVKWPETLICDSYEAMSQASADRVAGAVSAKPDALICLPAGESAIRTFQLLASMAARGEADFSRARFVQLDEWLDIQDEGQNCSAFLDSHFYGPLGIRADQVRKFDVHAKDLDSECAAMDDHIERNGPIDLMLLGLGMNGHLGLNEPGMDWDRGAMVVELSETTMSVGQKYFEGGQKLSRGITLGMRHVFGAKAVVLQVGGAKKAAIVKAMFDMEPHRDIPGTVMKLLKNGLVILDRDAAALLDAER